MYKLSNRIIMVNDTCLDTELFWGAVVVCCLILGDGWCDCFWCKIL